MKKKEILIIFVLAGLVGLFFALETKAFQPPLPDRKAVELCRKTGGIIEEIEVVQGIPPHPAWIKIYCLCPNGTRQSMFGTEAKEWRGCKIVKFKQLITVIALQLKAFLQKYYPLLLLLLVFLEIVWTIKRVREKRINRRQLVLIFLLAFFSVIGLGVWLYGFSHEELPAILAQETYLNPFVLPHDLLVKLGLDMSSLSFFILFFVLTFSLVVIFYFFILLSAFLLISELRSIWRRIRSI